MRNFWTTSRPKSTNTWLSSRRKNVSETGGAILAWLIIASIHLIGCAAVGPPTVARDRLDYVSAISESWKRQTLLNLLKTRYYDAPVFMDVASVINQYTIESEISLKFEWRGGRTNTLGGVGTYADRPTITYSPLMGHKYAEKFLSPLPITSVLLLVQAGYPFDHVLGVCAQQVNGMENSQTGIFGRYEASPEFLEILSLLRRLQDMDLIALRSRQVDGNRKMTIFFRPTNDARQVAIVKKTRRLLQLDEKTREFEVVHGGFALSDKEIAVFNRSLMMIMKEYAAGIEIPESDLAQGRIQAVHWGEKDSAPESQKPITVHSGGSEPDNAHVAVFYRKHWFWIDDRDVRSKAMFQFLMTLFSFPEREEGPGAAPLITVPTS